MRIGLKIKLAIIFIVLAVLAYLFIPTKAAKPASTQSFYKWQDAQGQWHYTDKAPNDIESSQISVRSDTNIIRSVPVAQPASSKPSQQPATKHLPAALNPAQAMKALEDAKHAKQAMEQRQQQLDSALN